MSNIAIKAENISKYYRLGQINNGTLYADIQSWFARKFGKEDPHAKISFDSAQSDKDGFWALKDINFEIKQGDRVGIIGRNGAGKSTLLKVISEITTPTTGNIYIKGRIASLLEVGTGFHPEMTGRENIYMNGAILGMKRAEITRQLDEIIDFAEIEKYIDTPVKRYSSGMYVRLAFAVAAHLQSEILIADEVLAVGDAAFQKKAIGKMSDLSTGEGRTVLFVSHNMDQIKKLCSKGIVLNHGLLSRMDDNITDSIHYYLGMDNNGNSLVTTNWNNNNDFFDINFTPLSFSIVDINNNIVTTELKSNNKYFIQLEVNIQELSSNVDFWIDFLKDTECLFPIFISNKITLHKGFNRILVEIPIQRLPSGNYTLSLGASLKNTRWILNAANCTVIINTTIDNPLPDSLLITAEK